MTDWKAQAEDLELAIRLEAADYSEKVEMLAVALERAAAQERGACAVLRETLEAIEGVLSDEIAARFKGSSKSEEQIGRGSVIYSLLSVPRNMARNGLAAADAIRASGGAKPE